MKEDVEQQSMAFHNRARAILFSLFSEFRQSITVIDRLRDENVFQQLQGRYAAQLRQRLQQLAQEILQQTESGAHQHELSHALNSLIGEYTREFVQKARSL